MRKVLPFLLLIAACSRESGTLTRDQQEYETVQEGSAAGVTSTVVVPGEVLPPMTGTNADTTTAFTLPTTSIPPTDTQQPGTLAGTLPPPAAYVPPPRESTPEPVPTASVPETTPLVTEATTPEPEQPEQPTEQETKSEPGRDEEQEEPPPPPPPGL
ncbi:MAG: hypothetical protein JJE51_02810 [Thermoanaerobaculia bacterium]|nr:hypothetical protein [Thermoanaerobaculia bacterium]